MPVNERLFPSSDVTRTCRGCKLVKPLSQFVRTKTTRSGFMPRCKSCERQKQNAWNRKNPEKARAHWQKYRLQNPELCRAKTAAWRKANPEKQALAKRRVNLRERGLTLASYDAMVAQQQGLCAICGNPPRGGNKKDKLHVDHCHRTGKLRGLLCDLCNRAIGMLRDNPEACESAARYLRSHR